jgi:hypothetical protein
VKGAKEQGRLVYRGNIVIIVRGPYTTEDLSKAASILAVLIEDERFTDGFEPDIKTKSPNGTIYTEEALKAEINKKLNELRLPAEAGEVQVFAEELEGGQDHYDDLLVARGSLVELFTNLSFFSRHREDVKVSLIRDVISVDNYKFLEELTLLLRDLRGGKAEISDGTLYVIREIRKIALKCLIPFIRLVDAISLYEREESTFFLRHWLDRTNNMRQRLEEIVEACKGIASPRKKTPPPGNPAALLIQMFGYDFKEEKFIPKNLIDKNNPQKVAQIVGKRGGGDSKSTIYSELGVLNAKEVKLVEKGEDGYCLSDWAM